MVTILAEAKESFLGGDYEGAVSQFRSVIDKNPDCAEGILGLGFALHASDRSSEATSVFEEGLKHCPNNSEMHFGYGLALMSVGDEYRAIRELKRTLELEPDHKLCPALLMKALQIHTNQLLKEGNFVWAEQMIEDQLELDEKAPDALAQMVQLKNRMSEYDEAKRYFRVLNEARPDYPGLHELAKMLGLVEHRDRGWLY